MAIQLKSVYEAPHPADGRRYLTETYWPEGVGTFNLMPYVWLRELAPSYELGIRAELERWDQDRFREEYRRELERTAERGLIARIRREAEDGTVTLLCDTHKRREPIGREDTVVWELRDFLERGVPPETLPGRGPAEKPKAASAA